MAKQYLTLRIAKLMVMSALWQRGIKRRAYDPKTGKFVRITNAEITTLAKALIERSRRVDHVR